MSPILSTPSVRSLLDGFAGRVLAIARCHDGELPDYYDVAAGRWFFNGGWTEGFWPGLLWRLHAHAGDNALADYARRGTRLVAMRHEATDDHDLGFLFETSCVLEQEITGGFEMRTAALAAAERLAARYRRDGKYIPAHGPVDGPQADFTIIDTVMNLPLLLWGAREANREDLRHVAIETAGTIMREHVRPDGSSCQVLRLDPRTGRTLRREAVMAVSVDSCWARGQAWGIQGFARMHRLTGVEEFREVAERMAGYFFARLPADGLVWHDLDDPAAPDIPKDTSAQAIAAGGLLVLAEAGTEMERGRRRAAAARLLGPLLEECLVESPPDAIPPRGLLGRGCKSLRKSQGIVSEIVFGDYYLVDALQRWISPAAAPAP